METHLRIRQYPQLLRTTKVQSRKYVIALNQDDEVDSLIGLWSVGSLAMLLLKIGLGGGCLMGRKD
jgi:hypothetical protein